MDADFVILADAVQVSEGKLFMLGGAWDRLTVAKLPTSHPMGIAVGILVPWEETNERHRFRVEVRDEDSQKELLKAEGELEQGRPPASQLPKGSTQRFLFGMNFALQIDRAFEGMIELFIDEESKKQVPFRVLSAGSGKRAG